MMAESALQQRGSAFFSALRLGSWMVLVGGLVASLLGACMFGPVWIQFSDVARVLLAMATGQSLPEVVNVAMPGGGSMALAGDNAAQILFSLRVPRVLLAAATGMGLAMAGTVFQGVLRNPLADPFTLGVSGGAAFGAALAISLGLGGFFAGFGVSVFAFAGAVGSLIVVFLLGTLGGRLRREGLILAGVIVSAFLAALLSLIKALDESSVTGIVFWVMGSFQGRGWVEVSVVIPACLIFFSLLLFLHRELDVLGLSDDAAVSLGISAPVARGGMLLLASAVTASCVAASGIIGFIGLVVPHFCRMLFGSASRSVLLSGALCGSMLLVWSDVAARTILPGGVELPVGVITALVGGPFFCFVFYRQGRVAVAGFMQTYRDTSSFSSVSQASLPRCDVVLHRQAPAIEVQSLTIRYPQASHAAVDDVSLAIQSGELVGILGPNGSGKSSLLRSLAGTQPLQRGCIRVLGQDIQQLSARQRALQVAMLPQQSELPTGMTVLSLVVMGRYPHTPFLGGYKNEDYAFAAACLDVTGTAAFAHRAVGTLSGGERQRVLLARALTQATPILLLDELTAGLDPRFQSGMFDVLVQRQKECGVTMVAALHDINVAALYCDRLVFLVQGRIVAEGTVKDVFTADVLESVYSTPVTLVMHPKHHVPQVVFARQERRTHE